MSGYFLISTDRLRKQAPKLSGIGFKIMLDILATARPSLTVKEFPLKFAQRLAGDSKLDHGVMLDFPGVAAETSTNTATDLSFSITHSSPPVTVPVPASRASRYSRTSSRKCEFWGGTSATSTRAASTATATRNRASAMGQTKLSPSTSR